MCVTFVEGVCFSSVGIEKEMTPPMSSFMNLRVTIEVTYRDKGDSGSCTVENFTSP